MTDPTTKALCEGNDERDQLRVTVLHLSRSLTAAQASEHVALASYESACVEIERLKLTGSAGFVEGYDQAVGEIRDHFKKLQQSEIVAEIEKLWFKGKIS